MSLLCTGVAKKRATPMMQLSLAMVSLGLISMEPLQPITLNKRGKQMKFETHRNKRHDSTVAVLTLDSLQISMKLRNWKIQFAVLTNSAV